MIPLTIVIMVITGLITFFLRYSKPFYFESALALFLIEFMAALWILNYQYATLPPFIYPHFQWAFLSFPLILFSRLRIIAFIWCVIFFVGLLYWSVEYVTFETRPLIFYSFPPLIAFSYLSCLFLNANKSILRALHASLFIDLILCLYLNYFMTFAPQGDEVRKYMLPVGILAVFIIWVLTYYSIKQKTLLMSVVISSLCILLFVPESVQFYYHSPLYQGLKSLLLMTPMLCLLFFYASIHYYKTVDILAILNGFSLSLVLIFTSIFDWSFYHQVVLLLFLMLFFMIIYFKKIRRILV